MEIDLEISDEDFVIEKSKTALDENPVSAKAWMITAKTLYPNNFEVQFQAYLVEKKECRIKEAAKCFSELISKFQQQHELWKEIEKITTALRIETDTNDNEKQFLYEMFKHILPDVQHKLLLFTADHCEDTMEHCRLLLLLLQRFPTAVASYGPRLVDTLISAEKHSVDGHFPVNSYRKLLVCDLLPLLAQDKIQINLPSKLLYKLLHKSIEFYVCFLGLTSTVFENAEPKIEDPWKKLFGIIEFIGRQLNWESYLINFTVNWSKESYWQKLLSFCRTKSKSLVEDKQLLFCVAVFFLYCLYEYNKSLTPYFSPGQIATSYLLVEAFTDLSLPTALTDAKVKKKKTIIGDVFQASVPHITVAQNDHKYIYSNFLICVNCWDLLNSSESLQREFIKMNGQLKLETWLSGFVIDYTLYKGLYEEALMFAEKIADSPLCLLKYVRIANILYIKKNYSSCLEAILLAIPLLPTNNSGSLTNNLIIGGTQRHLHYLPLTRLAVLQYLVKILLRCIKESMEKQNFCELSIGHIFTLVQLDWPQEEDYLPSLFEQIQQQKSFQYYNFQKYMINVDILEEIIYLWSSQGGQINLDVLPHLGQRRIGTRGSDKEVKEEIRQAIRKQIARNNERIDELIISFIQNEQAYILQILK